MNSCQAVSTALLGHPEWCWVLRNQHEPGAQAFKNEVELLARKTGVMIQLEAQPGRKAIAGNFCARAAMPVVATRQVELSRRERTGRMMPRTVDVIFISLYLSLLLSSDASFAAIDRRTV